MSTSYIYATWRAEADIGVDEIDAGSAVAARIARAFAEVRLAVFADEARITAALLHPAVAVARTVEHLVGHRVTRTHRVKVTCYQVKTHRMIAMFCCFENCLYSL